jgi:2'-5' RNA ligase
MTSTEKKAAPPLGPYWAGVPVDGCAMLTRLQADLADNHAQSLYQDGVWVSKAIDTQMPHITLCNQVKNGTLPDEIVAFIKSIDPDSTGVSCGEFDVFKQDFKDCKDRPDAKYDVIVWRPTLLPDSAYHQLHHKLHAFWDTKPQHAFNPHITIGYVQSGKGEEIVKGWKERPDLLANTGFCMHEVVVKRYRGAETDRVKVGDPLKAMDDMFT